MPRQWTKPLRELTAATTHGYSVIEFAAAVLGITLYPWQQWLLIHALELNEDGTYRFRKIFILVGRQNGKTLLLTVLSLWWLYMDADSFPEHLPARDFLVLGTAQNLDTAEKSWDMAVAYCDPEPDDDDDAGFGIPDLQAEARKPVKTNGKKSLRLKSGAKYEARAASRAAGRGKSAARVVMDEMREQQTWEVWGAVSKTKNAIFNSQLWGISSAGDAKSVVLSTLRDAAMKTVVDWDRYVETGIQTAEEFANTHDVATALFEWSAPDGYPMDDLDGILQANPSVGYKKMFLETIMSDLRGGEPEAVLRTEVLCQWVTALIETHLDGLAWDDCADGPDEDYAGSQPAEDSPLVMGIDTSGDRSMTYISIAGWRDDELIHVETVAQRAGMLWVPKVALKLASDYGITHVALQIRGCAAADFTETLREGTDDYPGLTIIEIAGTALGSSAGRTKDRVRDRSLRHRNQPVLNVAVSGAVAKRLGEVKVWDRTASVVDIASLVSVSNAQYGLENLPAPEDTSSAYEESELLVL